MDDQYFLINVVNYTTLDPQHVLQQARYLRKAWQNESLTGTFRAVYPHVYEYIVTLCGVDCADFCAEYAQS